MLQEPETPVRRKFRVANNEEGKNYFLVESDQHPPGEILQDRIIFILADAIVGMQVNMRFTQTMLLKKVVQHTHYCVRSLPCIAFLIN